MCACACDPAVVLLVHKCTVCNALFEMHALFVAVHDSHVHIHTHACTRSSATRPYPNCEHIAGL